MSSQTAVPTQGVPEQAPPPGPLNMLVVPAVILFIFYFLVIRPQQKQAKEHKAQLDQLKTGDRVLTQGGLYGTVVALKGNVVQLKIADNVRVELNRGAVSQILKETPSPNGAELVS